MGDTAVSAGLVGTPVVIVAALTAICTFVVPSLYEPITVLRLLFILAGGLLGPLGIAGMFFCMLVSASGMHAFGIPYLAPIAPSTGGFLRDGIIRLAWPSLAEKTFTVRDLPQDEKGDTP